MLVRDVVPASLDTVLAPRAVWQMRRGVSRNHRRCRCSRVAGGASHSRLLCWVQLLICAVLVLSCPLLHRDPGIGPLDGCANIICGSYRCEINVVYFAPGLGKPETRRRSTYTPPRRVRAIVLPDALLVMRPPLSCSSTLLPAAARWPTERSACSTSATWNGKLHLCPSVDTKGTLTWPKLRIWDPFAAR